MDPSRFEGLDRDTANRAGDYLINGEIARVNAVLKERHGVDLFPSPPWVLFDQHLSSGKWSVIEVYNALIAFEEMNSETEGESGKVNRPGAGGRDVLDSEPGGV